MHYLTKHFEFESAHNLPWHGGKCKNLHGHTYKLEVTVCSDTLKPEGILEDFGTLKDIVNAAIVEKYDHKYLNESFANPSAEIMAKRFFEELDERWKTIGLNGKIYAVKLWETSNSFVEYRHESQ